MNKEEKRKLREMSEEDLEKEIFDTKKELMKKERERKYGYGRNAGFNFKKIRKKIAMIKTIIGEKNEN